MLGAKERKLKNERTLLLFFSIFFPLHKYKSYSRGIARRL